MKLKLIILISLIALYFLRNQIYPYLTNVSGRVEIREDYINEIKPNSMLYITLHNEKGIIFAVKQIINPKFPLNFKITYKNVLFPRLVTPKCNIKAVLTYHGNLYEMRDGDIYSTNKPIYIIYRNVNISLANKKLN